MAVNQEAAPSATPPGTPPSPELSGQCPSPGTGHTETTPKRKRAAKSPPRIRYLDGLPLLPLLPPSTPRPKPPAAAPAAQSRESARGKCLGCTLSGSRCEFAAETKPVGTCCARCRRVGGTCLLRRPRRRGPAPAYDRPRGWVAADVGIEDEEAAVLAREMFDRGPKGRRRDVCGVLVVEEDVRGWACPDLRKVSDDIKAGEEGEVFWRRILSRGPRGVADSDG
ncbi:hypothetical protein CSOJ01_08729 [Colletotrichum sojae]|uniref:Uncharacterized protein n=1 Tax=Colletotrichum sojae TaxID=2175907 RepID=A0A8H6J5U9_9PEZI|nr:hypothetical protein CSOJ01_08729 [Colletotrichum sojae]